MHLFYLCLSEEGKTRMSLNDKWNRLLAFNIKPKQPSIEASSGSLLNKTTLLYVNSTAILLPETLLSSLKITSTLRGLMQVRQIGQMGVFNNHESMH